MKLSELVVPVGLDSDGRPVLPADANGSTRYFCPGCNGDLIVRSGDVRRKHFAHASADRPCSPESLEHMAAKRLISAAMTGGKTITIERGCAACGVMFDQAIPPGVFDGSAEEVKVGEFICDVVGFCSGSPRLAVEVFFSHAVGDHKADCLKMHWIEVRAADIISNPLRWAATSHGLKPGYCEECMAAARKIDGYGIDRSVYSLGNLHPGIKYAAKIGECWRCSRQIPIFCWPGVPFCETSPPAPRPKTVQKRFSRAYGGSYWCNTCPGCGAMQGDNFIDYWKSFGHRDATGDALVQATAVCAADLFLGKLIP